MDNKFKHREEKMHFKMFEILCEKVIGGEAAQQLVLKAKDKMEESKTSSLQNTPRKPICIAVRGPYDNKKHPRVCIKCGQFIPREEFGKQLCPGNKVEVTIN